MTTENIYLKPIDGVHEYMDPNELETSFTSDTTPLIRSGSTNENAFTIRRGITTNSFTRYIKIFLVLLVLAVIIGVLVNNVIYAEQVAEYKKVKKIEEDK